MNIESLKDNLTIVIPSKNESRTLYDCIYHVARQSGIAGTRIIIADISDKEESLQWIRKIETDFKYSLKIEVIQGGFPSEGRLNGSRLVTTPFLLFLDADIFLTRPDILKECIGHEKGLLTVPFYTDKPYRWVFRMFDLFQGLSKSLGTPFAVGGFQLWRTETYWKVGGYNPEELFAEDYSISQKVDPDDFKINQIRGTYTSGRRFENKGVVWMFRIMIKSYINRNNPEFFKHHHGYWD
jgi:glycosyltransferase involved in cell wall biosynthesis